MTRRKIISGNTIKSIGGTTSSSAGRIRLANTHVSFQMDPERVYEKRKKALIDLIDNGDEWGEEEVADLVHAANVLLAEQS